MSNKLIHLIIFLVSNYRNIWFWSFKISPFVSKILKCVQLVVSYCCFVLVYKKVIFVLSSICPFFNHFIVLLVRDIHQFCWVINLRYAIEPDSPCVPNFIGHCGSSLPIPELETLGGIRIIWTNLCRSICPSFDRVKNIKIRRKIS